MVLVLPDLVLLVVEDEVCFLDLVDPLLTRVCVKEGASPPELFGRLTEVLDIERK
jgi:hypothetical protein